MTDCILWTKSCYPSGYGQRRVAGRQVLAHRYAYECARGPVPEGLELDHLCGNKRCVNVDHLEPVTHAENIRRGRGTRLTAEIVEQIRAAPGSHRQVALRFGISKTHVGSIKAGTCWVAI
jgi:hypothetical protein